MKRTIVIFCFGFLINTVNLFSQLTSKNLFDALAMIKSNAESITFDNNGFQFINYWDAHNQGIAFYNDYFYITMNRTDIVNNRQLAIIKDAKLLKTLNLSSTENHPGGIQVSNGYMVVPWNTDKLSIFNLNEPSSPSLVKFFDDYGGECSGILNIGNNYLVASYLSSRNGINFVLFDAEFNVIKNRKWYAHNQDKSNWYPYKNWQDELGSAKYEGMSLLKVQEHPLQEPVLYLLMYHNNPETIDVFEINSINLDINLNLKLIYSLPLIQMEGGFRYGGCFSVDNQSCLNFFSTEKHIDNQYPTTINKYLPEFGNPLKLPYKYDTGGKVTVTMDDYGNCLEFHKGIDGGGYEKNIFYRLGKIDKYKNQIIWGDLVFTGWAGDDIDIDLNNNGNCVISYRGVGNKNLYYRIGKLQQNSILWGSEVFYDTGGDVSVTLDDANNIVEIHRGYFGGLNKNKHYYNVGAINTTNRTISWKNSYGKYYDTGSDVSVSLSNLGRCVEVHNGSSGTVNFNNRYYKIGIVNFQKGTISWSSSVKYDTGDEGEIEVNNSGYCVEVHKGRYVNGLYYKIGKIDYSNNNINWFTVGSLNNGKYVTSSIDINKSGVFVYSDNNNNINYRTFEVDEQQTQIAMKIKSFANREQAVVSKSYEDIPIIESNTNGLKVFPNPAQKIIKILWVPKENAKSEIVMKDLMGRIINRFQLYPNFGSCYQFLIPDDILSGIYLLYIVEDGRYVSNATKLNIRK